MSTIKGTTKTGFKFELREELLDDYELVVLFGKANDDIRHIDELAEHLLGSEQKKALIEHLRGENGTVKLSDMMNALADVEAAFPSPAGKNS